MSEEPTVLFTAEPSIKPTLTGIVAVLGLALLVIAGMYGLGVDPNTLETAALAVSVLAGLVILRLLVRLYVLKRTTYTVTDTDIRREYSFLLRRSAREIPIEKLRGLHYSQTPFQTLFGYGSLEFLTAGQNGSLGFVSFDNVPSPSERRETIRTLIQES